MNPDEFSPLVPTGALIASFRKDVPPEEAQTRIQSLTGRPARCISAADKAQRGRGGSIARGESFVLESLGIAIVEPSESDDVPEMAASIAASDEVEQVRPEYFASVQPAAEPGWQARYAAWLREGACLLAEGPDWADLPLPDAPPKPDTPEDGADAATWGLRETGVLRSPLRGRGVRVAIIDTGINLAHPDFEGRGVTAVSFVPYEDSDDRHGHGTHCFGTACGGVSAADGLRYGIADEATAFVAKCLDAAGNGRESWIFAGIDWALAQGCDIISMSLGRPALPDGQPDPVYERLGQAALDRGALIVAASGNGSSRPGYVDPVMMPAAARSILAVGAVTEALGIAPFSNGRVAGAGPEIDLTAPGVNVFSAHLPPFGYKRLSGTSMATPHVAGIAALLAESDPTLRGPALFEALKTHARDIGLDPAVGGAGLVRAPGA